MTCGGRRGACRVSGWGLPPRRVTAVARAARRARYDVDVSERPVRVADEQLEVDEADRRLEVLELVRAHRHREPELARVERLERLVEPHAPNIPRRSRGPERGAERGAERVVGLVHDQKVGDRRVARGRRRPVGEVRRDEAPRRNDAEPWDHDRDAHRRRWSGVVASAARHRRRRGRGRQCERAALVERRIEGGAAARKEARGAALARKPRRRRLAQLVLMLEPSFACAFMTAECILLDPAPRQLFDDTDRRHRARRCVM